MANQQQIDLSLKINGAHVLITGGNGLIGKSVVQHFLAAGSNVSSLDLTYDLTATATPIQEGAGSLICLPADITDITSLTTAWQTATSHFGPVSVCVSLAALDLSVLPHTGLIDMDPAQWARTLAVNVGGTMAVSQLWLRGLRDLPRAKAGQTSINQNLSLILIGSESGSFGERYNPDYAASKSAVQGGLLRSLAMEAVRIHPDARVNAVAPGPVDTDRFKEECKQDPGQYYADAEATVAQGRPVPVENVARTVVWLASGGWSGSVHGQVVSVNSGKNGKLVWREGEHH